MLIQHMLDFWDNLFAEKPTSCWKVVPYKKNHSRACGVNLRNGWKLGVLNFESEKPEVLNKNHHNAHPKSTIFLKYLNGRFQGTITSGQVI